MSLNQNNKLKGGGGEGRLSCCTISRMPSQRALNHTIVSPLKHWRLVCSQRPQGEERTNFSMKSFWFCTCCTIPVVTVWGALRTHCEQAAGALHMPTGSFMPAPAWLEETLWERWLLSPDHRRACLWLAGTGHGVARPWLAARPVNGHNHSRQRSDTGTSPWTTPQTKGRLLHYEEL